MTLKDLKDLVMLQTGNDVEDYVDFAQQSLIYLNEGYRRVYQHWMGVYPEALLALDTDIPAVPSEVHAAIADWATWLLYRNGNSSKQNRGLAFKDAAEKALGRIKRGGGMTEEEQALSGRWQNLYS